MACCVWDNEEANYLSNELYCLNYKIDDNFKLYNLKLEYDLYSCILDPHRWKRKPDSIYGILAIVFAREPRTLAKKFGIVLDYGANTKNGVVLKSNKIWILGNTQVVVVNLDGIRIEKNIDLDDKYMGHFFEIHEYQDDFIIYGEFHILRMNQSGEIVWEFSGGDIFVVPGNKPAFVMNDDNIYLLDFEGNEYYIDYNGQRISPIE